jgi:hypothetical protein
VPEPCESDALADRRSVTVIVRLVLDRQGRLVHGEVIDTKARMRGRFTAWDALVPLLRAVLEDS